MFPCSYSSSKKKSKINFKRVKVVHKFVNGIQTAVDFCRTYWYQAKGAWTISDAGDTFMSCFLFQLQKKGTKMAAQSHAFVNGFQTGL